MRCLPPAAPAISARTSRPPIRNGKGAASRIFVEHAAKLVRERGGRIANADITLICEAPRVGPHREAMTEALSAMLGISSDRISIKATTNEKLGFVGREEGIAAIATASVVFPGERARMSNTNLANALAASLPARAASCWRRPKAAPAA